jgi:hypothetical protein
LRRLKPKGACLTPVATAKARSQTLSISAWQWKGKRQQIAGKTIAVLRITIIKNVNLKVRLKKRLSRKSRKR